MVGNIYFNNDKIIIFDYDKKIRTININSFNLNDNLFLDEFDSFIINFTITTESLSNYLRFYNHLIKKVDIVINLSDLSDEEIKNKSLVLKEIESITNCSFKYRYDSYGTAKIDEILGSIDFIERQAFIVKYYNFSPIEALLFIYDMVRNREYKEALDGESVDISRNLTKVLKNKTIVCSGFANIFSAICNKVGIYTENIEWKSLKPFTSGHCSNLCYVNDRKYNIHGILSVDVTRGCKKGDNNNFLNNYNSFGNSFDEERILYSKSDLIYVEKVNNLFYDIQNGYDKYISVFNRATSIVSNYQAYSLLEKLKKYMLIIGFEVNDIDKIKQKIKRSTNKDDIRNDIEKLLQFYDINDSIYKLQIPFYDFVNIIYNVRRVEYSIDSSKYLFTQHKLHSILNKRYSFNFPQFCLILYLNLFISNEELKIDNEFFEFGNNYFKLDAERMKLISVLKKIKNKKDTNG